MAMAFGVTTPINEKYEPGTDLLAMHSAALAAVDPYGAVERILRSKGAGTPVEDVLSRVEDFRKIVVVGAGKATARMALAAEAVWGTRITQGMIVVKYGHRADLRTVRQVEAGHPVPDDAGASGTREILDLVRRSDASTLILCLLSGGGSALLVAPAEGVTLSDKQTVTDLLLKAGASIEEMNAVRKHISAVKGGRLAREAHPASLVTLLLSDVVGDRLDVIASGPTVADGSTYDIALQVIEKYGLRDKMPPEVTALLERGKAGKEPETLKAGDPALERVRNYVVGSNRQALEAARARAQELGYAPTILTDSLRGDAREAAHWFAERAVRLQQGLSGTERICLLAGGETTLAVEGSGKGGRNQEMALAFAVAIEGHDGISFLAAGTDGTDGPTDAAGAFVNGGTAGEARRLGIDPLAYLANNDSYTFFQRFDKASGEQHHLLTGPTGTNVMDLQYLLVAARR